MNRPILLCALFAVTAAALGAQESSQSSPYEGTSNPPADDAIVTTVTVQAKPRAGHPLYAQPSAPAYSQTEQPREQDWEPQPTSVDPAMNFPDPAGDYGTVRIARPSPERQDLTQRAYAADPDGDIVHPHARRSGELGEGTTIRVKLLGRLSTSSSEKGETFRSRVASDVLQGDRVLIPAGTEIDGRVVQVSSGHAGGRGSMRLRPETVILPDGQRFRLHAEITGTPGSRTHIASENAIVPDSRLKRDTIEYSGAVGGGAVTGAMVGGPVGAVTGGLIGAGVITAHLLISHPQATLEPGTAMLFTLTEPLDLVPAHESYN